MLCRSREAHLSELTASPRNLLVRKTPVVTPLCHICTFITVRINAVAHSETGPGNAITGGRRGKFAFVAGRPACAAGNKKTSGSGNASLQLSLRRMNSNSNPIVDRVLERNGAPYAI